MSTQFKAKQTEERLKANLKRLEKIVKGPYARPMDYLTRDRLARRLGEVERAHV